MGDGGCAVLISRPSLFEFYNPESCHADQARGRRVWAPELVPLKEASSDSGGSPSGLKGDDGELLWAPVGLCSMEPRPSSQGGEATKEKDEDSVKVVVYEDGGASTNTGNAGDLTMSRQYHSRWGNVVNHLTSPRRPQQTDEHNGSALGAEQGADWVTTPAAISHEQPQHPGNINLSPLERSQEGYVRRVRGLEQSAGRSHSASGRDDTGEAKQIRVGDCGSQESFHSQDSFHASGKSNWKLKEIEEGRNKHSSSVGRHCHANIADKDVDFNSKVATSNYQDARQGNSHAFIGLKGKEEDHGSRAADWESNARQSHRDQGREAKERRSSNWEDQGDQGREAKERRSTNWEDQGDQGRETKERRSSNWDDQDNLHPSGRGGWRGKENGVVWSCHGVTDGSREKEETRYRNADRDRGSHGGRQYSSSRDRVHDTGSSSGHFEGSTHRSSLERHASTDRSSYPRDYHGRDCSRRSPSDRSGSQRSSSDRPGGRQEGRQHRRESDSREYSGRHEEKHYRRQNDGREHRQWNGNGHARDRRQCRSWEERAADNRLNFPQDSLGNQYSHPDNGLVDESRHAGMEVPMDLSPAPLTVGDGSERPPELTRDMVSNLNCVEDAGSESVCNHGGELKSAGWIYLDSGGVMQGPMELGALKELLEKGKLQSDHLVSFDGGKEWVTLEHAGSPLEGCNSSLISASSGPNFLPQVKLDRDCKSHQQWLHPVEQALTAEDTRKQKGLGESLISEKDSPECSLTLEQTLPKKACTLTLEQTLPKKAVLPSEDLIDFRIDERVEHLMQGFALVPGKEKEAISDALSHATRLVQEDEVDLENEVSPRSHTGLAAHWKEDQLISDVQVLESLGLDSQNSEDSVPQTTLVSITMMDDVCVNSFQSARKWTSRGGDWKLVCQPENTHILKGQTNISSDRFLRTKVALNGGVPLCESWHSGLSDPRRQILESSYSEALKRKRLELPPWIHRYFDERNECIRKIELCPESKSYTCLPSVATPKVSTPKSHVSTPVSHLSTTKGSIVSPLTDMVKKTKPVKGMAASRLEGQRMEHACMGPAGSKSTHSLKCGSAIPSKNPVLAGKYAQASLMISDTLIEQPEKMKHFGDTASDWLVQEKIGIELPQTLPSCALVESELDKFPLEYDKPSQQLATKGDLKLLKGDWYYKDGAGHENGPFSFANLQLMVEQGGLHDGTSVYRKSDDTWVSISVSLSCHETLQSRAQEKDPSPKLGGLIPDLKLTKPVLDVQAVANDEYQAIKGLSAFPLSIQASGFSNEVIKTPDLLTSSITASLHVIDSHQLNPNRKGKNNCSSPKESTGFHQIYPQFLGYMCGKLHEHVMRSYKSRDCAATLDDCLEKWFSDKQSKSTMDPASVTGCPSVSTAGISSVLPPVTSQKCVSLVQTIRPLDGKSEVDNSKLECEISDHKSSAVQASTGFSLNGCEQSLHSKPQVIMTNDFDHVKNRRTGKRRRLLDIQESHVLSQPSQMGFTSDSKSPFFKRETLTLGIDPEPNIEVCKKSIETDTKRNWMMLEPHLLMRIFRFLDGDFKSLVFASATCKSWRASVENSKNGIRQIDLSSLADFCNDSILESFTAYAGRQLSQLSKLILRGCTAVSPLAVKSLLQECPSISTVDITGCNQLKELTNSCLHIKWVGLCLGVKHHRSEDPPRRLKSLRLIGERKAPARRALEGSEVHSSDDSSGKDRMLKCEEQQPDGAEELLDFDSFHCMDRDSDTTQVASAQHVIKYMKVNDAQKILKFGSVHKLVPRECAVIDLHARENGNANTNDRKWKKESAAKPTKSAKAQFSMADKFTSSKSRGDLRTNGLCAGDRDKSIEKDMALVLKAVKEADTEKYFFYQVPDSKVTAGRALGLSDIEEKLRGGAYPGSREGVRNFKNDLFLLCRSAFHVLRKGSPVFKAGEEIFKLAYRLVSQLEKNSFAAPINEGHNLKQICNSDSISKGDKRKFRSGSNLLRRKRKGGDDVSRGRTGKRRRDIDESSADGDSQDSPSEKEGRRFPKIKKKQWTEWEVESSGTDEEDEVLFEEEEEETEESEADMESESEGDDEARDGDDGSSEDEAKYQDWGSREWGARMTHASMVPPITRKYEVIEEYVVVTAESDVKKRMQVRLPEDYDKKLQATRERKGSEYSHLEIPELKEYKPRKRLGQEVIEQEVYGIDPYTHNLLLDTMAKDRFDFSDARRQQLIEEEFLRALNKEAKKFTESGKAPMKYPLEPVVQRLVEEANDPSTKSFCQALLRNMQSRPKEKYVAYRKGLGVVCNKQIGFEKDDFVVEFFGEVYPAWRWFEKQDAIRSLQKKDKDPAPEFYNIFLERPRGDASGYDLVVVDAMHKANYASRICHSCRPNCEAKVTAVDGRYQIGVYTLRPVQYGEELTFDYNSVTESKEEYEASVCLCGSQGCRGSYLHLAGSATFQEVMKECHGLLHRHYLLLEACVANIATQGDLNDLKQAGLGSCLLEGLPNWAIGYAARVVRFINQERIRLPRELLKNIVKERRLESYGEQEMLESEVQADGVYNQRLQNLAITLDKVRYVFKEIYGDSTSAPPPLRKLEPVELVCLIWKGENSVVADLLRAMAHHRLKDEYLEFKRKVREHDPVESGNVEENLRQSLLWLRDELCKAPAACLSRHDAAADIIHMYAYTKFFFTSQEYRSFESPPLTINPLDLGPKYAHTAGSTFHQWSKTYNKDYVLGQLMFWYKQNVVDPGSSLAKARRGCLVLPDLSSCYAKSLHQTPRLGYGCRHRAEMFQQMEERPQKQWPKQKIWEFKNGGKLFGSPMMDAIRGKVTINREMMDWLKNRPVDFDGPWDN